MIAAAAFCFAAGFLLAWFISVRAAFLTTGFFGSLFASFAERMAMRSKVGQRARQDENQSRLGKLSNRLLQIGTTLGILSAMTYGTLRLLGVPVDVF